jgi:hypothetical protein
VGKGTAWGIAQKAGPMMTNKNWERQRQRLNRPMKKDPRGLKPARDNKNRRPNGTTKVVP